MVGPSLSGDDRDVANTWLKLGFVLLVTLSGGLVALQAGGTTTQLLGGFGTGFVFGALLLAFFRRWGRQFRETKSRLRR